MFDSIIKKINYTIAKNFYLKNKDSGALSFSNLIEKANEIFIVMPESDIDFSSAVNFADDLLKEKKQITFFIRDFRVSQIPNKNKIHYFDYGINDITKLKLPSKRLVDLLKEKKYDAVIDLNIEENIFAGVVSNLVDSKFRIGFTKINSDKFYNLQFSNLENNSALSYKNLLNSLKMF